MDTLERVQAANRVNCVHFRMRVRRVGPAHRALHRGEPRLGAAGGQLERRAAGDGYLPVLRTRLQLGHGGRVRASQKAAWGRMLTGCVSKVGVDLGERSQKRAYLTRNGLYRGLLRFFCAHV